MAHVHKDIDFVVSIYIVHTNHVLLILHKKLNRWLPIGGHIELGEDPDQALFREVEEECGLKVNVLSNRIDHAVVGSKTLYTPAFMEIHEFTDPRLDHRHRHIALIYYATSESDSFKLAREEHDDIRWFSKNDLTNPTYCIDAGIQYHCRTATAAAKFATKRSASA